jgi:tetratricopeptide (TPR) repeat protein
LKSALVTKGGICLKRSFMSMFMLMACTSASALAFQNPVASTEALGSIDPPNVPVQAPLTDNGDDAEASFRFAGEATARGDVAGAIAALERVLQTNPDLANVKLELGLLYTRAGNFDLARSYLEVAINAPEAPEEARQRARTALRSASGALGRFGVAGFLFAGAQFQTNPNGSPSAVSVTGSGGIPVLISGDDLSIPRGSDLSGSASGSVEVRYGLGGQRGNDLVADLTLAQTNYVDTTELDATYLNARLGPRFFSGGALAPTGFVRPYLTGTLLALGHARYFGAYGAGLSFLARPSIATTMSGQIGYERRDYDGSRRRPVADEQSGDYWSGVGEFAFPLSPRARASAALLFERVEADRDYWSRATYGVQTGTSVALKPPKGATSWLARLTATYRRSDYQVADPLVDTSRRRDEDRFEVEAGLSIPLAATIALDLRASQTWNESNLPNYDYRNTLAAIGVSYRF